MVVAAVVVAAVVEAGVVEMNHDDVVYLYMDTKSMDHTIHLAYLLL